MKYFLHLLILMVMTACGTNHRYQPSDKEEITNVILRKTAFKIKDELELIPFGTGGRMLYQIKLLRLIFQCHRPVDLETGRQLLVASVQELVSAMNEDERVRPYLDHYPVGAESVEIEIYVQDSRGASYGADALTVIVAKQGTLEYRIDGPETHLLSTVLVETYEEALQKIEESERVAI